MSTRIALAEEPTREEWLAERQKGIGGSEVAAALGISPFKSPFQLWLEKTGKAEPAPETFRMRRGTLMEPVLLQLYTEKTGRAAVPNGRRIFRHPKHPIVASTPDAFEIGNEAPGIELKNVGFRAGASWGEDGSDMVPDYYLAQVAVEMATTFRSLWYVAANFDDDFRVYPIKRDRDLEEAIIEGCERFWRDHVEAGVAPEATRLDLDALKTLYPREAGEEIRPATPEEADNIANLIGLRKVLKGTEEAVDELEAKVKSAIGQSAGIIVPGIGKVTWKEIKGKTVTNWEALAMSFKPTPLDIEHHTKVIPGPRRFLVTAEKGGSK